MFFFGIYCVSTFNQNDASDVGQWAVVKFNQMYLVVFQEFIKFLPLLHFFRAAADEQNISY